MIQKIILLTCLLQSCNYKVTIVEGSSVKNKKFLTYKKAEKYFYKNEYSQLIYFSKNNVTIKKSATFY